MVLFGAPSISVSLWLFLSLSLSLSLPLSLSLSPGTLAVCVNNSAVDPGLHTVALQFLCVLFSEETKRSGVRDDPGVTSDMSAALDGPGASDLCDLLLQVAR